MNVVQPADSARLQPSCFFKVLLLKLLFSTIGNVISKAAQQLSARQLRASAVADGIAQHVMFSCNVVRNSRGSAAKTGRQQRSL